LERNTADVLITQAVAEVFQKPQKQVDKDGAELIVIIKDCIKRQTYISVM
jgi:hypothetical protein